MKMSIFLVKYIYTTEKMGCATFTNFFVNQNEGIIVLFVSLCEGCIIGFKLFDENGATSDESEISNTKSDVNWKKIQLQFKDIPIRTELYICVHTAYNDQSNTKKFWMIDNELRIYDTGYQRNVKITLNSTYLEKNPIVICDSFGEDNSKVEYSNDIKKFTCNKKDSGTCTWGYWNETCEKKCEETKICHMWGMNCKNSCDNKIFGNMCSSSIPAIKMTTSKSFTNTEKSDPTIIPNGTVIEQEQRTITPQNPSSDENTEILNPSRSNIKSDEIFKTQETLVTQNYPLIKSDEKKTFDDMKINQAAIPRVYHIWLITLSILVVASTTFAVTTLIVSYRKRPRNTLNQETIESPESHELHQYRSASASLHEDEIYASIHDYEPITDRSSSSTDEYEDSIHYEQVINPLNATQTQVTLPTNDSSYTFQANAKIHPTSIKKKNVPSNMHQRNFQPITFQYYK